MGKSHSNNDPYKIVVTSDWHCGSSVGLANMERDYGKNELVPYQNRRQELWDKFTEGMREVSPFNELWLIGDAVNGPGNGAAKRDNLVNVIEQQVVIATDILDWVMCECKWNGEILICEGTEWHVSDGRSENDIAKYLGKRATKGKIITRRGIKFDVKHFVSGSNKPQNFGNSLGAEYHAAVANASHHGTPTPDVIIRAHRHLWARRDGYRVLNGKIRPWYAIGLPALQCWGSDYAKKVSGGLFPDIGFVEIIIEPNGKLNIEPHLFFIKSQVMAN
jgi:hypothetical protein